MTVPTLSLRQKLLVGASLGALMLANAADAQIRPFARTVADPAAQAARAAQQFANRDAAIAAAAARTRAALERAAQVRSQMDTAQQAARAAAQAAQSNIANGLAPGGLQVAEGVVIDPGAFDVDDPRLGESNIWLGANGPTQQQTADGRTEVTVDQTQQKAILTWDSFNVGRETDLIFNQHGNQDWVALNRVTDASADPTRILGNIRADGSVYVINRNGVIFGGTSQVNVRNLIASSLDIAGDTVADRNRKFLDGILFNPNEASRGAILTFGERHETQYVTPRPDNPDPVQPDTVNILPGETFAEGDGVTVEAGAIIQTADEGSAILLGHNVVNRGSIHSPQGQVLLAAGRGVYLARNIGEDSTDFSPTTDPDLRGLNSNVNRGGRVENRGIVTSDLGNVTFNGMSILQGGFVQTTTSATLNGSITFKAGSGLAAQSPYPLTVQRFGDIVLAAGSTTQILPDDNGEKAIGFDSYRPGVIDIIGRNITFEGGSTLFAPSADVRVIASRGNWVTGEDFEVDPVTGERVTRELFPGFFEYIVRPDDSRIYLDAGAVIDLGGLRGVEVAASQNTIQGQLRANELRDNPVLRDSALRSRDVFFDARKGIGIADLSGYYGLIERDVRELMTTGGNLSLVGPQVVTREGSTIDISGGSLFHQGGYVRSSMLIAPTGQIVRIEDAVPGVEYLGFYGDHIVSHSRWGVRETFLSPFYRPGGRYEAGYSEGRSAGRLQLGATQNVPYENTSLDNHDFRILDGTVRGDVVVGENQRDAPTGATAEDVTRIWRERPQGAELVVGYFVDGGGFDRIFGGDVTIGETDALPSDFTADTALDRTNAYDVRLSDTLFGEHGFSRVTLNSGMAGGDPALNGGTLTIEAGATVDLGAFGSFTFNGTQAEIDGTIRAAGGTVSINTLYLPTGTDWAALAPEDRPRIRLGEGAAIDVAGRWVNDFRSPGERAVLAIHGGRVSLTSSNEIILAAGSLIDASGGGHLAADGRTLTAGNGGAITLVNNILPFGTAPGTLPAGPGDGRMELGGELRGFALGRGATLTIATPAGVVIGDTPVMADGTLPAGEEAAADFILAADLVIPAGGFVPIVRNLSITTVAVGEPLPFDVVVAFDYSANGFQPLVPQADWEVPAGVEVLDLFYNYYVAGQIVPRDTPIQYIDGTQPEGAIIPAEVFPGFAMPIRPIDVAVPPGITDTPVTIAAGTRLPRGITLDQPVSVVAPTNLTPDFFTQGGFARYAISGGGGITLTDGTALAPVTQSFVLDGIGRDIKSGTNLNDVARRAVLPDSQAQPMHLAFALDWYDLDERQRFALRAPRFTDGDVTIGEGARITLPNESLLDLRGFAVRIDGVVDTPGGEISARATDIRLGATGALLARGYATTRIENGVALRTIRGGGFVDLIADPTQLDPTGVVATAQGSLIDVSGVRGIADFRSVSESLGRDGLPGYTSVSVDGAAGRVRLIGLTGVLAGTLDLAPGGETGRGGELTVIAGDRLTLSPDMSAARAALTTGPASDIAGFFVSADRLNASGADDLQLGTSNQATTQLIVTEGDIRLTARESIELNAGAITGTLDRPGSVELVADFVSLTGDTRRSNIPDGGPQLDTLSTDFVGDFTVRAETIEIGMEFGCGTFECVADGISGAFETVDLIAARDIRLRGARLRSASDINLIAAQTVVMTRESLTPYRDPPEFILESGTRVTFASNGAAAPVPPIFGGILTVRAPEIVQGGVIRSPYGEINLQASERLTLLPGSLTSISLEGTRVPLGFIFNFNLSEFTDGVLSNATVRLDGAQVDVQEGAVIDVSGGGDLSWYQFVLGNGGSRDILDLSSGYLAVVPSLGDRPYYGYLRDTDINETIPRPNAYGSGGFTIGDQVYLDGIEGLPAGVYTLLPAEFARMTGGMLVKATGEGGFAGAPGAVRRDDGRFIVGGYGAVGGTSVRDADYQLFEVMPQSVFTQYSEIMDMGFNAYIARRNAESLAAAANTNSVPVRLRNVNDAGTLLVAARDALTLDGTGRFGAGTGGLLGNVDIAAQRIAVTSGGTAAPEGFLVLDAGRLNAFGAGSLLLGGTRQTGANGTDVTVIASEILVDTGGTALSGTEILIAASDRVTIADGAAISASGSGALDTNALNVLGDGALLRASIADRVAVRRAGASGSFGTLDIGAGAKLGAAGSLSFDASGAVLLNAAAIIDAERLDLSSLTISLGDVPEGVTGTILSNATLSLLGQSRDLLLRASNAIEVYGNTVLGARTGGTATLGAVTFDSAVFHAVDGGSARVTAGDVIFRNSGAATDLDVATGAGTLAIDADRLILDSGTVRAVGFAGLDAEVGALVGRGQGTFELAAPVRIAAGVMTAEAGSDTVLRTAGDLALLSGTRAAPEEGDFGGRLAVAGADVTIDARVTMSAGIFEANASGNLTLGANADFDMRGRTLEFRDVIRHAAGGGVRLAAGGAVTQAAGSTIDVSADARGGDAGFVEVDAGGAVDLAGGLTGAAGDGFHGGGFALETGSLADFGAVNARLETGGFTSERMVHVATGDLVLAAGQTLTAHDVLLRSDAGGVRIAGAIDASGTDADRDGGSVRLIGGNGVDVAASARIDALAATARDGGFAPDSGMVELAATGGRLNVASGAVIDLTGGKQGGGEVIVRALRDGGDIAIDALAGSFVGARDRGIYGMQSYEAVAVDAGLVDSALGDAATWMIGADVMRARLDANGFEVRPGISFRSAGDLLVDGDISLADARYGAGAPGYVEFVAAGNLDVNGTVSDGFSSAARDAALLAGRSWSYGFEAGGDMTLGASGLIRTGTGDIRIDVGRDLMLAGNQSVIYTAGSRTETAPGFTRLADRIIGEFPTMGGDIAISAGRDILAPMTRQAAASWLFRYGDTNWTGDPDTSTVAQQTSWSVVFKNYEQGVGALGGGNIDISAGRDISQLAVSLPTTGHMTRAVGETARAGDVVVRGGGDLTMTAGRDVLGGVYMLGEGEAVINAGGAVRPSATQVDQLIAIDPFSGDRIYQQDVVGALFALMDASATVTARGDVEIEAAFDPMSFQDQVCENHGAACDGSTSPFTYFNSHTERTAINLSSVSGDVIDRMNPFASTDLSLGAGERESVTQLRGSDNFSTPLAMGGYRYRVPGSVRMTSLRGDVSLESRFGRLTSYILSPTDNGTLEMVAQGLVDVSVPGGSGLGVVELLDKAAPYRRTALHAFGGLPPVITAATNYERGFRPTHIDDPDPVRLYAMTGGIAGAVRFPKMLHAYAGSDLNLAFTVQNNRPEDVTLLAAGRDYNGSNRTSATVTGPGRVVIEAGRNVTGGASSEGAVVISGGNVPVRSSGFPVVPNLALDPDVGADVYILAGANGPVDYEGFAAVYFDPANGEGVVRTYLPELAAYMAGLGFEGLQGAELVAAFGELPLQSRTPLLQQIYFTELRETGLDYNDPESPRFRQYDRGYEAIERLFTADPETIADELRGSVLLDNAAIETTAGGNITILAPYGEVEVGAPVVDNNFNPNNTGIVTRKGGDIRIMANENIDLFTSRIFTLLGGDITLWTSNGDITAGAGAKTGGVRPPLVYSISNDALSSLNVFGLQTGSGIGVLDAGGTGIRKRSRLDLVAPRGEVNAGDAGIRVVGDLNIAALRVVGVDNIQVTGEAIGLPEVVEVNTGALTAATAATSAVVAEATRLAGQSQPAPVRDIPAIVQVRFVGFGE